MAIDSHAALIGTSEAVEPHAALDELAQLFAFEKISRRPPASILRS